MALAEGVTAFALLIFLQFAVTCTRVRSRWVCRLVTGEPILLLHAGHMLPEAMRAARVTEDEGRAVVPQAGLPALGVGLIRDGEALLHPAG